MSVDETKPKFILRRPAITGVHLVDKGDNPGATVSLFKRRPAQGVSTMPKTAQEILAGLPDEDRKTLEAALASMAQKPASAAAPAPVEDAAPAPATDMAKAEVEALRKRVHELEDASTVAEVRKQVATDMAHIPGAEHEKLVSVLKSARTELSKVDYETLVSVLKSASAALSKSVLFAEVGSNATDAAAGDAAAKVEALAKRVKEANPSVSMSKARTMVYEQHPELYAEIRKSGGKAGA